MRKNSKLLILLVIGLFVLGLVAGCGGQADEPANEPTGEQSSDNGAGEETAEAIKIGVNYELSGAVATFGGHTVDGINLAFEEINAAGGVLGRQIELVTLDNKSAPEESTSVATKLIGQENVVAHLGAATTGATLAAVPVATQYGVPLLTTSATNPDVTVDPQTGETRDYIFRVCFTDPPQGIVGAAFAHDDLGAEKAAVYYDNTNDYSKGLAAVFMEEFEKLGGEIVAEEGYGENDQDFRPTLTKFKNENADLIYVPGYYDKVAKIVSQGRELEIDATFLGADGWDSPELVNIAGAESLNDTFFTNHYSSQDPAENVQSFVGAYNDKYGEDPDSFAALGYDAAYLLADAIERAGSAEPEAIKDALAATKDFDAVTGKLTFDDQHNPVKEIAIIEMVDGKQVLKTKIANK